MSSSKFSRFFGGSHLPKKNQPQGVNTKNYKNMLNNVFKHLIGTEEKEYMQEVGENVLYRVIYFSNHADMFYKFTEMSRQEFESHIVNIKNEIEGIIKNGVSREINKIQMLNGWMVELEKLLDEHLLYPLDQQCQEMYSLLLRHASKSQSFDARSPEDFKVFLQEIRNNHRVAKAQLEAYSSGEADIRVKDSALTTLRRVSNLLKPLKEALNKQLAKVRESTHKLQKDFDQSYHKLLRYVKQSDIFTDEEPEQFKQKLKNMNDKCLIASSQIEKYLSGTDSSEERKYQAFEMLEKSLVDIKEIEKNLILVFDIRSHMNKITIEIQKSYKWLLKYAEQSQHFANQKSQEFKENLKHIKNNHKCACDSIEQYLSQKHKNKEKYFQALQEIEKYFDKIKEVERDLDIYLSKYLNNAISQTYHKLLKHIDQSPRLTSLQQQNFIDDLKEIDRRREQTTSAIKIYLTETDVSEEKSEVFRVLEEIKQELDLSLANEINAEIMHRRNRLDKYQQVMAAEESEQISFKERLERIENQCKDANAKLEPYFSGNDISEEDKNVAFETLEESLEKTKVIEIDMTPFLKGPVIEKIDQNYAKLVQGENKSPIFTKQELQDLNQDVVGIKEYFNKNDHNNDDTHKALTEDFNEISKLERRIALYLQLQVLHNRHVKISSRVEKYLNNTVKFDSEEKKKIRKSMEQNVVNTNDKFEKVKKILQEDNSPLRIEYLGELSLNEYNKSIESLTKQASRLLGFDLGLHSPKAE